MQNNRVNYFCGLIIFLLFPNFLLAQTWAKVYGLYGVNSYEFSRAIIPGHDGTYIIVCLSFNDELDFGVVNIDTFGNIIWQKSFGGKDYDGAERIQRTLDGGYVVTGITLSYGAGSSDFWVTKLDKSGSIIWQNTYGGDDNDEQTSVVITKDNGIVISGVSSYSFGIGTDAWIIKLNKNGNISWQKIYGMPDSDGPHEIIATSDGGLIMAGYTSREVVVGTAWIVKLDINGNIQWEKSYERGRGESARSIVETNDGGYLVGGMTGGNKRGAADIWILKLDVSGNIIWQRAYGGSDDDIIDSIVDTPDNGYIILADTKSFGAGAWDILLFKIDDSGNVVWQRTFGDVFRDSASQISKAHDGGYIITGITDNLNLPNYHTLILKITEDGTIEGTCSSFHEANLKVIDTKATVRNTSAKVRNTNVKPHPTNAKAIDTTAVVDTICSSAVIDISCQPTTLPFLLRMSKCSVKPNYGYTATIYMSCAGLPTGAACKFSPDVIVPIGDFSSETTLTVEIRNAIEAGIYPFQIVASNGAVSSTFNMNLKVNK
ncbi:MAG: hypothetical protein A2Y62_00920 [Candidatus Fischerbacteria bacterium RBG_13_37_8]|uniref:Bulb-type lectin domain-containing protein n=1 Tax=Candidatus Fischerbacteria bacterium RBG_13_37_8 TaxID=1817863 RepID=A0A1F5VJL6_9BACT|nr:MAG: hypothetical protein A2Y62_00920 [Candidatus Fischerbacteria bacterium RBG_13_37_8]